MSKGACPNCGNQLFSVKCSLCGFSSIPQWIRLRHESEMSMTFHPGVTQVNRSLINKYFRNVCSDAGHPIAAYFPSDDSPLFFVEGTDDGWVIGKDHEYRNKIMINGKELQLRNQIIEGGTSLQVFSDREKTFVGKFVVELN